MGFLSKILAFALLAYAIWATANKIYRSLGGGQAKPPAPAPGAVA